MTERQDRRNNDEVQMISQKMQSITTNDPNLRTINEQSSSNDGTKLINSSSMNSIHEKNKKSSWDENSLPTDLPGRNLPERILFVVDAVKEPNPTKFETTAGLKYLPLTMIKRVIDIFVTAKSGINKKHEYALMTLKLESGAWIRDFTSDRKAFLADLEKMKGEQTEEATDIYDLGPCFETIYEKLKKINEEESTTPRDFVTRVIFIYARSKTVPFFVNGKQYFHRLFDDSHFYFDCLYVHEPLNKETACQRIYSQLGTMDYCQTSYILEVGRNLAALHTNMAKLIAHPLQRARQDNLPYTFYNDASLQESRSNG